MTGIIFTHRGRGACLALILYLAPAVGAAEYELSADTWARPRSAEGVLAMAPVRAAVNAWMATPAATIEIRYPGGESGLLWAGELRDWLVSLGVPLARIKTLSGSAVGDRLQIQIRQPELGQ